MKTTLILLLLAILSVGQNAIAAPAYPLEDLLTRAETVFIGNITKQDNQSVSFTVSEPLRGENKNIFDFELLYSRIPNHSKAFDPPVRYFVISQGDNFLGKPKPFIQQGQGMFGQAGYCGWIMFPIATEGVETYLKHIASYHLTPGPMKISRITQEQARKIVAQNPYRPDIYGKSGEGNLGDSVPLPPEIAGCRLIARTTKAVFSSTEPVILQVALKNGTKEEIHYPDRYPAADFSIQAKDESGASVFHTAYADRVWRNKFAGLPAGEEAQFELKISDFTGFKLMGTYSITVQRRIERPGQPGQFVEIKADPVQIKVVQEVAPASTEGG